MRGRRALGPARRPAPLGSTKDCSGLAKQTPPFLDLGVPSVRWGLGPSCFTSGEDPFLFQAFLGKDILGISFSHGRAPGGS